MSDSSEFIFKDDARTKLYEGIQKLTRVVAPHFGSKEIHPTYLSEGLVRSSTLDLLRQIHAEDPFVDAGIELGRDLARRVFKHQGDGVTTSLICMHALVERGMQHIRRIHNFLHFRNGIERALKVSLEALEKQALPVNHSFDGRILRQKLTNELDLPQEHLATIEKIAGRGIFIIEQGSEEVDQIEFNPAIRVKVRLASPYFLQGQEHPICEFDDSLIAIIEGKIESIQELLPLLKWIQREQKSLILIADAFSEDAVASLVLNYMKGAIKICALKPPKLSGEAFIQWRRIFEDNCHLVAIKLIQLSNLDLVIDSLGFAKKTLVGNGQLSLFSPSIQKFQKIDPRELFNRNHERLKEEIYLATRIQLKNEKDPVKREQRQRRMQKTFRFIEEAREKGMVLGGGIALYSILEELDSLGLGTDENLGADCVRAALTAPLRQIIQSSGLNGDNAWKKLKKIGSGFGVDLRKKKIVPIAKEAIFDSLSILSYSFQEGVSQGALLLTSEAIVAKND